MVILNWHRIKVIRSRQDSNLRGETPLDFKSNALTTRPRLLSKLQWMLSKKCMVEITIETTIENIQHQKKNLFDCEIKISLMDGD